MDLGLAQNGPPPVAGRFFFLFLFFFFPSTLHTRPSTSNTELFYVSPARVQIPSRHRCKSTRTTLSCLLFPDSHRMVNLPPPRVLWIARARGRYARFGGRHSHPHWDKYSFVSVWYGKSTPRYEGHRRKRGYIPTLRTFSTVFRTFPPSVKLKYYYWMISLCLREIITYDDK